MARDSSEDLLSSKSTGVSEGVEDSDEEAQPETVRRAMQSDASVEFLFTKEVYDYRLVTLNHCIGHAR